MTFRVQSSDNQMNRLRGMITSIEESILTLTSQSSSETELEVKDRSMRAFAISSQVGSEKFLYNHETQNKFDLRTYNDGGTLYYPWLFSKTLKHSSNGLTSKVDLDRLLAVSSSGADTSEVVSAVSASQDPDRVRMLEGVMCGNSYWVMGCDTHRYDAGDGYLTADNTTNVCEMVEVYEKALLRDTSFINIQKEMDAGVTRAIQSLNNFHIVESAYNGPVNNSNVVSGQTLFRGIGKDETIGPYVSQFLILPFSYNGIMVEQKYPEEIDVPASLVNSNFLDIQRGKITGSPNVSGNTYYVSKPRMLASIVHNDPMYWAYYNAAIIGLQYNMELEFKGTAVTTSWTDHGPPDGLASIATVSLGALRTAWHSKWNIGMKIRPEVMAHRVDKIMNNVFTGDEFDTIRVDLTTHAQATLDELIIRNSNYLLPLMYPEGSPTHPSYPAGHATIAGACTTLLKAYYKTHDSNNDPLPWPSTPQHSVDGLSRVTYSESDASQMTIVGEFNKLASNISIGRNMAGVHYRADGDRGIELGEEFAICYLQTKLKEYISTYNGMITDFKLEKFNGDYISITVDGITILKSR
jgi:hypothetical protein